MELLLTRDVVKSWALRSPLFFIMKIFPATDQHRGPIMGLLETSGLPVKDIADRVRLFVAEDSNSIVGTVGIEFEKDTGLLRSLAVDPNLKGRGLGKKLVFFIESFAKDHGVRELYLLTTTAETFFAGLNYKVTDRDQVPGFIKETTEFKGVCPASAVVMKKML